MTHKIEHLKRKPAKPATKAEMGVRHDALFEIVERMRPMTVRQALRSVLVVGATAVVQHVRRGGRGSPWIVDLLKRKPPKLAAVALANKMARIAWKLMITGNSYTAKSAPAALMGAA